MATTFDLDHVAVAVERHSDAWPRYAGDLAGAWLAADDDGATGFRAAQLRYANGMKVEVLEPYAVGHNDFLRRFLDRNGPGPHHLTFKVADIGAALASAEAAGFHPVGVDLSHPDWKEAFLHPKEALGVVVQLAQSSGDWTSPAPGDLPAPRTPAPAALDHVTHTVADLADGLALFRDLLRGSEVDDGQDTRGRWVELAWPGPGRIRLLEPPAGDQREWLAGARGRVDHLAFTCADPGGVADARSIGSPEWEVPPEANRGTRLVLRSA